MAQPTPPSSRDPSAALSGTVVADKYELKEPLGRGGMGWVYLAEQRPVGRRVAMKLLHEQRAEERDTGERFFREALALSQIQHPNVASLIDYGRQDSGQYYLVMEYLDGRPLDAEIARVGRFKPGRAVRVAVQLCRALAAVHEQGIVHRDLKPSNVFLTRIGGERDFVKLIDFGVAQHEATSGLERITQAGMACGTPQYMSPEQIEGASIDLRADLYAVGLLLYEMLEGRPPFDGQSSAEVMHRHLTEAPPEMKAPVPRALREVVFRLLAKQPDERPSSAEEVLPELLASVPVSVAVEAIPDLLDPNDSKSTRAALAQLSNVTVDDATQLDRPVRRAGRSALAAERGLLWAGVLLVFAGLLWLLLSPSDPGYSQIVPRGDFGAVTPAAEEAAPAEVPEAPVPAEPDGTEVAPPDPADPPGSSALDTAVPSDETPTTAGGRDDRRSRDERRRERPPHGRGRGHDRDRHPGRRDRP